LAKTGTEVALSIINLMDVELGLAAISILQERRRVVRFHFGTKRHRQNG